MRRSMLIILLLGCWLIVPQTAGVAGAQGVASPPSPRPSTSGPQPDWWGVGSPYRWEEVNDQNGHHWLAVWAAQQCYNQQYTPGNLLTCVPIYGCIDSWAWWLKYPESKLGVPETWRNILPGAKNLSNYTASCFYE